MYEYINLCIYQCWEKSTKYDLKSKSIIMFVIMISNQNQIILIKINLKS